LSTSNKTVSNQEPNRSTSLDLKDVAKLESTSKRTPQLKGIQDISMPLSSNTLLIHTHLHTKVSLPQLKTHLQTQPLLLQNTDRQLNTLT
ncbi:hypothetical protein KC19_10G143900, partial [Ceratodon purpureus]